MSEPKKIRRRVQAVERHDLVRDEEGNAALETIVVLSDGQRIRYLMPLKAWRHEAEVVETDWKLAEEREGES